MVWIHSNTGVCNRARWFECGREKSRRRFELARMRESDRAGEIPREWSRKDSNSLECGGLIAREIRFHSSAWGRNCTQWFEFARMFELVIAHGDWNSTECWRKTLLWTFEYGKVIAWEIRISSNAGEWSRRTFEYTRFWSRKDSNLLECGGLITREIRIRSNARGSDREEDLNSLEWRKLEFVRMRGRDRAGDLNLLAFGSLWSRGKFEFDRIREGEMARTIRANAGRRWNEKKFFFDTMLNEYTVLCRCG